jgi:hypothetical protein
LTTVNTTWLPSATTTAQMLAAFRAVSSALDQVGVVRTSDTGQIDLSPSTPVVVPASAATGTITPVGDEIRKLESPGKPTLYVRVRYSIVAITANTPSSYRVFVEFWAGLATDGAGVVSSGFTRVLNTYSSGSGPTSGTSLTLVRPLMVASDGQNYLTVVNDPARSATSGGSSSTIVGGYQDICLERTINPATGAYDSDGFVAIDVMSASNVGAQQILNCMTLQAVTDTTSHFQTTGNMWASSGDLSSATIMPLTVSIPKPKGPARMALVAYRPDVTPGGQYAISMYGQLVNYLALSGPYTSARIQGSGTATYSPLYRFS